VHVGTSDTILRTAPHLDVHPPHGHRERGRAVRMEVRVLELSLGAVECLIGMSPCVVRRIATAVRARHRDPGGDSAPRLVYNLEPQRSHGPAINAPPCLDLLPSATRHIDDPEPF